jgi:hypothetical protein
MAAGPQVELGLGAAWGFATADLTSPALAGAAGALLDTSLAGEPVTELRIHGVSGSNGPIMLEHPHALQVAGDGVTGFYRRWNPGGAGRASVRWKLEAYSWGGLTEAPLACAAWLLLAPFMLYNVAHFMLPPDATPAVAPASGDGSEVPHLWPGPGHRLAGRLLRLLALAATVEFVTATVTLLLGVAGWQAAGRRGVMPTWMGWYGAWTAGWRLALALVAVLAVIAALWWISVQTAAKYEARVSRAQPGLHARWPLTQPGFWRGGVLVHRQRDLHTAAACAAAALITVLPAGNPEAARWIAIVLAAAVLAAAATLTVLPLADHQVVSMEHGGQPPGPRDGRLCRVTLFAGLAALVIAALVSGWTDQRHGPQAGPPPGLTGVWAALLIAQAVLLAGLAGAAIPLARRARAAGTNGTVTPYLNGGLTALVAALAVILGGLLSAVINTGVTRLMGTPVPGNFRFDTGPAHPLAIPWPVYAFGAAPVGLLAGLIVAAAGLLWAARRDTRRFATPANGAPSPVAAAYRTVTAGSPGLRPDARPGTGTHPATPAVPENTPGPAASHSFGQEMDPRAGTGAGPGADTRPADVAPPVPGTRLETAAHPAPGDGPAYLGNRTAIARAWAVGLLADRADAVLAALTGGALVVVAATEIAAAVTSGPASRPGLLAGWWHGLASLVAVISILVAGWLVALLHAAYSNPGRRRTIGMIWDVGTFWPRAVHPLAPPCYGERAIPEVVDRIRLLTGRDGRGHAPSRLDAAAELPDAARSPRLSVPAGPVLLTGYSQGAVIAPAVIAQLPADVRSQVALLTLASPARRLYGRAFPAYFGGHQLETLRDLLDGGPDAPGRWRNLRRRSDYIGSWVFAEPPPRLDAGLTGYIDQPCWDPVVLVPDADPVPPPVHRHSAWWPDPRTSELGGYLAGLLAGQVRPAGPAGPRTPPGPGTPAGAGTPGTPA